MSERDGTPFLIDPESGDHAALARLDFGAVGDDGHDEAWLQVLLESCPNVLPIRQIEPGFGEFVSVCRELPLALGGGQTGYLDNLYLTSEGQLLLVEVKLWRNPEARRKVVAHSSRQDSSLEAVSAVWFS